MFSAKTPTDNAKSHFIVSQKAYAEYRAPRLNSSIKPWVTNCFVQPSQYEINKATASFFKQNLLPVRSTLDQREICLT